MIENNLKTYVAKIIEKVRKGGDTVLSLYSQRFDGLKLLPCDFRLTGNEKKEAMKKVSDETRTAISATVKNVFTFHKTEKEKIKKKWRLTNNSITTEQVFSPVESVGLYVCGGIYPYPSTVIMCAIPARVAGVKKIVMTSPPKNLTPEVIYAAELSGIDEIYRLGGAHAIAALAFGSQTIPKVDLIAGPGNIYVTEAKRQLFGKVGIDSLAGPSEVVIICDSSARADFVSYDLLAQAEHHPQARGHLFTSSRQFIKEVKKIINNEIKKNKKFNSVLKTSQIKYHNCTIESAIKAVNEIAPEHLEIIHRNHSKVMTKIKNAGAVFIGPYTPVALGDYYAGPSHVLPTAKSARFSSGLSVMTFLKRSSIITAGETGLKSASKYVLKLAENEKMYFHLKSIEIRLKNENKSKKEN